MVVEQFRPGVMERLGLDYESLFAESIRGLSTVQSPATGSRDRSATKPATISNYVGDAGLLALSMGKPANPVLPPALVADIGGGAYPAVHEHLACAAKSSAAAVKACRLDVSMADNLFTFMYWAIGNGLGAGEWPGQWQRPRDGRHAALSALCHAR